MKRQLFFAVAGLCFCAISFGQNMVIQVPKTTQTITIDGQIDSVWNLAPAYTIDWWGVGKATPDPTDFSASFKLMWNDSYLYFLGMITDDVLLDSAACHDIPVADWEVDNWETYISPGNSYLPDGTEDTQVRLPYANAEGNNSIASVTTGYSFGGFSIGDFVKAAKSETFDGWDVEASYDLSVMATSAGLSGYAKDDTIGFNAVACDNDGTTTRKHIGNLIQGFTYNECDTLLRLVLGDIVSGIANTSAHNISVYPTLATDQVWISNITEVSSVDIYDLQGRSVDHIASPAETLNVSSLRPGMYFVRVYTRDGKVINQKIIKQ